MSTVLFFPRRLSLPAHRVRYSRTAVTYLNLSLPQSEPKIHPAPSPLPSLLPQTSYLLSPLSLPLVSFPQSLRRERARVCARGVCAAVGGVEDASISCATIARVAVMVIELLGWVDATADCWLERKRAVTVTLSTAPPSLQPQLPLQSDRPLIMHGEVKRFSVTGLWMMCSAGHYSAAPESTNL